MLLISDTVVLVSVMAVAHVLRFGLSPTIGISGAEVIPYWFVTAAIVVVWLALLQSAHARETRILGHGLKEYRRLFAASGRTGALVAVVGFVSKWDISRGYLIIGIPLGLLGLIITRQLWRRWIHRQRDLGHLQAQVLVVGAPKTAAEMTQRLLRGRRSGFNVVGVCLPPHWDGECPDEIEQVRVLGPLDDAVAQCREAGAEFILLSGNDAMAPERVRELSWSLEGTEIGLIMAPAIVDVAGPRMLMSPVDGLPLVYVDAPNFTGIKLVAKGVFDKLSALVALAVLGVPMLVIALLVRLSSPGPALFRQERVGLNHEPFQMVKFRSMYSDAEQRLAELEAENEGHGAFFKMRDDPRVTPIGRFLRRFSVDELPQLINVLKGDMSLVGPRPPLPREVEQWGEHVGRRQLVKPGITGLWQVSGRSDLDWQESVRLDLYYTENWSITGDFVIVLRTIMVVLTGRGAY